MDFYDTLIAHGFRLDASPVPGDEMKRCKTDAKPKRKNGWYKLALDGKKGWFGDFSTGLNAEWSADATQIAILPRVSDEELKRRRAEAVRVTQHAIASAQKAWNNLSPMRAIHPYIQAKNLTVQGCDAIRVDNFSRWFRSWYKHKGTELHVCEDLLVLPMYRNGNIVSLQAIDSRGKKLFWKDAPTKGAYLPLSRPGSTITILTEGFATGLALFQSIPSCTVIVCFSADNLITVAGEIDIKGMAVVAADNDHATAAKLLKETGTATNPGIEKGQAAAKLLGIEAVWPSGLQGSDWCDAMNEWGAAGASGVRRDVLRAVRPVRRVQAQAA